MPEFSFINQDGMLTMNDLMVTLGAVLAGIVAWRQKAKDEQLKARDETIEFLKKQITYLVGQLPKGNKDDV